MLPLSQGIMNQNIEFWMVPRSYTFLLLGLSVSQVAADGEALVVFRHFLFKISAELAVGSCEQQIVP